MVQVMREEIDIEGTMASLRHPDVGAVISYLGTVRSYLEGKKSQGLSFEVADVEMKASLEQLEAEVLTVFDIKEIAIVHRTGSFAVGDSILLIAISSGHRGPAFDACKHIIDRIKEFHDTWKKEVLQY